MHKVNYFQQRGMTIVEIAIGFLILSILIAMGTPTVMTWLQGTSMRAATEFYSEGLQRARIEAIRRNASVRFVVGVPDANGWSIDWCQSAAGQPCDGSGAWTNVMQRPGAAYDSMTLNVCPGGSNQVDFTSLGWVNPQFNVPISAIRVTPSGSEIRSSQLEVPLSGIASICVPEAGAGDSRVCQVTCP